MSRIPALGRRGEGWVAGQVLLLAAIFLSPLAGRSWASAWAYAAGGVLVALGAGLLAWAGAVLGSALTPFPAPKPGGGVADDGPYALVRHPMYGAGILVAFGWSVAFGSWLGLALAAALLVFFDLKSRREEAWLATREGYAAYRARTPRRLLPFLY